MTDINAMTPARIQIDQVGTERLCFRCLDANGQTSIQTTWGLEDGRTISDAENLAPDKGEYFDGILVLLPGVLLDGVAGEYGPLSCISGPDLTPGYDFFDLFLFSTGEYKFVRD